MPRYAALLPEALFMWPIRIMAHFVFSANAPNFFVISLASFARFISMPPPKYACIGSKIKSLAPVLTIACSNRSSTIDSDLSLSSITIILSQSAPASSSLGFTVSARPSSAVWYITLTGPVTFIFSSSASPFDSFAARFNTIVVFPSPGSPWIIVSFP